MIHAVRDEIGLIEVVETAGVRTLHFGNATRQSALSIAEPDRVELGYIRAMLMTLLFVPEPRNALVLGLGGGSLAKFLLQHCPACQSEVVEYRTGVLPVARRFFRFPADHPRLTVHLEDCHAFVIDQAAAGHQRYDHIHIDVYDGLGIAGSVFQHDFFSACKTLLASKGFLAINLWGTHPESFRESMRVLNLYFTGQLLRLNVPGRGNVVIYAPGEAYVPPKPRQLDAIAQALTVRTGIEFTRMAQGLRWPDSFR